MTNEEKRDLQAMVMAPNPLPVKTIAAIVGCSKGTVRKYKKVFAK